MMSALAQADCHGWFGRCSSLTGAFGEGCGIVATGLGRPPWAAAAVWASQFGGIACASTVIRVGNERGGTMVMVAISVAVLFGFAALVIDLGFVYVERARLQAAADSAATAAAYELPDAAQVQVTADSYVDANDYGDGSYVKPSDIVVGHWNRTTRTFTDGGAPSNAVQGDHPKGGRANGNPVQNLFGGVIGFAETDVTATAIALKQNAIVDFEGLPEGAQPATVSVGNGISGDPIPGEIRIDAFGGFGPMIFDSTCDYIYPLGCSGGDADLETPTTGSDQGNVLIQSEDGDSSDPDDHGGPCPSARCPAHPAGQRHRCATSRPTTAPSCSISTALAPGS